MKKLLKGQGKQSRTLSLPKPYLHSRIFKKITKKTYKN